MARARRRTDPGRERLWYRHRQGRSKHDHCRIDLDTSCWDRRLPHQRLPQSDPDTTSVVPAAGSLRHGLWSDRGWWKAGHPGCQLLRACLRRPQGDHRNQRGWPSCWVSECLFADVRRPEHPPGRCELGSGYLGLQEVSDRRSNCALSAVSARPHVQSKGGGLQEPGSYQEVWSHRPGDTKFDVGRGAR
jgi:hypothetical protein